MDCPAANILTLALFFPYTEKDTCPISQSDWKIDLQV